MLKGGFTTGTCATAASKAAVMMLSGKACHESVMVALPDGDVVEIPVLSVNKDGNIAKAVVCKDAGDDPDITHGARIIAHASFIGGNDIILEAGEGIGIVTKPGLSVNPGEPAINPVPREMIISSIKELTARGVRIILSIPGGKELAVKTFNPRLGIVNGLSILGTTGRVRPFSCPAIRQSILCFLDVAKADGVRSPCFVPGHIGEKSCRRHFITGSQQVIEVSNEWGFVLENIKKYNFEEILILGHPGKLAKLAQGSFDTHSSRSISSVPFIMGLARKLFRRELPESSIAEGIFSHLEAKEKECLGNALAQTVQRSVITSFNLPIPVAVVLVDMKRNIIGSCGDLSPWK